eukprot:2989704-Amphidinium_carterae.1
MVEVVSCSQKDPVQASLVANPFEEPVVTSSHKDQAPFSLMALEEPLSLRVREARAVPSRKSAPAEALMEGALKRVPAGTLLGDAHQHSWGKSSETWAANPEAEPHGISPPRHPDQ